MLKKIISCIMIVCLAIGTMSAFAADATPLNFFGSGEGTYKARNSGYGITYVEELDIFVAYGAKDSTNARLYVSRDGLKWTPKYFGSTAARIMEFAYGNNKAILVASDTNSPHTENKQTVLVSTQYLDGFSWATTVPADAKTNNDYVSVRGTMIFDSYTGKFWAGAWKFNADGTKSNAGMYYTDGALVNQIYNEATGEIVAEAVEGETKTRKVMVWTKATGDGSTDTEVYDPNTFPSLTSSPVFGWISSNGKGFIIAGLGFSLTSYDPRTHVFMADVRNDESYLFKDAETAKNIKTGILDGNNNLIFSVSSGTSGEGTGSIVKTTWSTLWAGGKAMSTIKDADTTATIAANEAVEEFVLANNMIFAFPQRGSNGDVKVITYNSDKKPNDTYINLFNDSNATINAFMSTGDRMNKAAVSKDGRVVAMTGKPYATAYTYTTSNASKMLVFDTKDLSLDSTVVPTESLASIATIVSQTDEYAILVNGEDKGNKVNEEIAVSGDMTIEAEFYGYAPNKKAIIALYDAGNVLVDVKAVNDYNVSYEFKEIPEGYKAKVFYWHGDILKPLAE